MAELKKQAEIRRKANGQFAKGVSGSSCGGRPKKPPELKDLADKSLEEIKRMIESPDTNAKIKADLCRWIYEQQYGRAQQKIDMDATSKQEIIVTLDGELDEYAR